MEIFWSARAASCSSWVTMTKVCPILSRRSKKSRCSSCLFCESREPLGSSAKTTSGQSHEGQKFLRPLSCLAPGRAADERWHHHVLQGGEFGQELVELEDEAHVLVAEGGALGVAELHDVYPVDDDAAAVGLVEGSHYLQEGGLACAACADDADDFAPLYVEVDALEHLKVAEAFLDVANLYHRRTFFPFIILKPF